MGFDIDTAPYQRLFQLRLDKQWMLQRSQMAAGSPATYSWETHAGDPDPLLLDSTNSIGHSPAATARWLRDAAMLPKLSDACQRAEEYLSRASAATDTGIPGLMPNVWPISLFERTYGLYVLLLAGLLGYPDLSDVVQENLDHIDIALREHNGLNFGETFAPDVDTTGVGTAVLAAMGREVDPSALTQFECDGHFETFRGELNASVLSNAHAAHGLKLSGHACSSTEEFLVRRQNFKGTWEPDKWHVSWGYITLEVLAVLRQHHFFLYRRACQVLLANQDLDGAWGSGGNHANVLDTSYAMLTLRFADQESLESERILQALRSGLSWLSNQDVRSNSSLPKLWLGKELYSPYRVDRIYLLGAMLSTHFQLSENGVDKEIAVLQ